MNDIAANSEIDLQDLKEADADGAGVPPSKQSAHFTYHQVTQKEHVAHLLPLAQAFHLASRFAHITFSEEKYFKSYLSVIGRKNEVLFFVCLDSKPVAVIGGNVSEYYLGVGAKLATTFSYYVSPSVRHSIAGGRVAIKLIRVFTDWAKQQGAEELHIHATVGVEPKRVDRFFKRLGFEVFGGNYAAKL